MTDGAVGIECFWKCSTDDAHFEMEAAGNRLWRRIDCGKNRLCLEYTAVGINGC